MKNQDFEKLGFFYLGKEYDLEQRKVGSGLVLYESKQLTTHAVCVGMTGSGKTGLCLSLLEEAAIDGIPVIAIDPKGDLGIFCSAFLSFGVKISHLGLIPTKQTGKGSHGSSSPIRQQNCGKTAWLHGVKTARESHGSANLPIWQSTLLDPVQDFRSRFFVPSRLHHRPW